MNPKKLIILAIVFAVLAVAGITVKLLQSGPGNLVEEAGWVEIAPESFLKSDVAWFEIWQQGKEGERITLNSTDSGWTVGTRYDAPGDEEKVDALLDLFKGLMGEIRSESEDMHEDFGLKDKALHLKIVMKEGKGDPIELLIGKDSRFVRYAGDNRVYAVSEEDSFTKELGIYSEGDAPDVKRWVKKDILKVDKDNVKKLTAVYPDKKFVFEKKEKSTEKPADEKEKPEDKKAEEKKPEEKKPEFEWVISEGAFGDVKAKAKPAEKILSRLENLKCNDAADPAKLAEYGLDNPAFRLDVLRNDDSAITILGSMPKPDSDAYIMIPDSGKHVYVVSSWVFTNLFPKASDVLDGLPKESIKKEELNEVTVLNFSGQKLTVKWDEVEGDVIFPELALRQKKDKIKNTVTGLENLDPDDYAAPGIPDEKLGFSSDSPFVEAVVKDGKNRKITVGGPTPLFPGRYVKYSWIDGVYGMRKWKIDKLLPEIKDLFEQELVTENPADIVSFKLTAGSDVLEFTREADNTWKGVENGKDFPVNPKAVKNYLAYFNPLKIQDVALKEGNSIVATVLLQKKDGTSVKLFVQKGDKIVTVTEASTAGVYTIDDTTLQRISGTFQDFKAVLKAPETPVKQPAEKKAPVVRKEKAEPAPLKK